MSDNPFKMLHHYFQGSSEMNLLGNQIGKSLSKLQKQARVISTEQRKNENSVVYFNASYFYYF